MTNLYYVLNLPFEKLLAFGVPLKHSKGKIKHMRVCSYPTTLVKEKAQFVIFSDKLESVLKPHAAG